MLVEFTLQNILHWIYEIMCAQKGAKGSEILHDKTQIYKLEQHKMTKQILP